MRTRLPALLVVLACLMAVPLEVQVRPLPDTLTIRQWIGADTWTWTLTRRTGSDVYDAVARHDTSGSQSTHEFRVESWDGTTVVFFRPDAGRYRGVVTADGRALKGTTTFGGSSEGWEAALPAPGGGAPAASGGLELPASAAGAFERGAALRSKGDLSGALAAFTEVTALAPTYAEAWRQRGLVLYSLKRYPEALADFTRCTDLNPADARGWVGRGSSHRAMGQADAAMAAYNRAIEIDPAYSNAYMNRAGLHYAAGNAAAALADYTRAIDTDPKNAQAWHSRAVVRVSQKDAVGARADFARSLEIDPNHPLSADSRSQLAKLGAVEPAPPRPTPAPAPAPAPPSPPPPTPPPPTAGTPPPPAAGPASGAGPRVPRATLERTTVPRELFKEGSWPTSRLSGRDRVGPELPAASGAPARLPEGLDFNDLTPGHYQAALIAAKEAMRLISGPLSPADEERFELQWAPLLEYPCQPAIDYFNKLSPLLNRFIETRAALVQALLLFGDAYEEAIIAAGLEDDDGVIEAMGVAGVHRESAAALEAALVQVAEAIDALGDPPDPLVHRGRATARHLEAAKFVKGMGARGGLYWVLVESSMSDMPKSGNASVRYTHVVTEGRAQGSIHSSYVPPGQSTPRRSSAVADITWTPMPRLIPVNAARDFAFDIRVDAACTDVSDPQTLPGGDAGTCAQVRIDPTASPSNRVTATPASPSAAGGVRFESPGLGNFPRLLPVKLKVEVATPGGYTTFQHSYDLRQLTDAQVAEIQANAAAEAAGRADAQSAAAGKHASALSSVISAQAEREARQAAIAFAKLNQEYFQGQLTEYRERARTAAPGERERFEYLAMVMDANLQAERDNQQTIETGEWTRTRTAYDDWNFRLLASQGQQAARDWAQRSAVRAAVPRLIAQLPKELRETAAYNANRALTEAIATGDEEVVKAHVNTLANSVKGYWSARGQEQQELAEVSDVALSTASNIKWGADNALFALSFVTGGWIYTTYSITTGTIEGGWQTGLKTGAASLHPSVMVAMSAYDGYHELVEDPETGEVAKAGISGALWSAGKTAAYALAMQRVVAPAIRTGIGRFKGSPPEKWPTVEQQLGEARFQSRMANGRAKVRLFQQRAQLLRLARTSTNKAEVARLQTQAQEAAKAIKCDYAAKMALNQSAKADPPTLKMYLAIDADLMGQVERGFQQGMATQGYAPVETRSYSNSASSGRAGMDVDIGIVEPARFIRAPDGRVIKNPVWDHWRRKNLLRADGSGQRRVSLEEFRRAGQEELQRSFDQIYGGPGRPTAEAGVNFTTSLHAEAYNDTAWIGRRGLPHADFDGLTPGSAQQAGDVTAFKLGHAQGSGKIPDYLKFQEGCRTMVKDMNTKLIGADPKAADGAPPVNPKSPLAKANPGVREHLLELRDTMQAFAENRIGPIEADRRIRALTGGEGLPEVVRQFQDLLGTGVK